MPVLRFLDAKPKLRDGTRTSEVRCDCLSQAHLQAVIEGGEVVSASCPACGREALIEILPDGEIGFFPPGVTVIS